MEPVAVVHQALPVKPLWRSGTVQALVTGLLASAAVLSVAVDQLIGLITTQGQYIPPTWTAPLLTGLSMVNIAAKFIALQKRTEVGDLTTGAK